MTIRCVVAVLGLSSIAATGAPPADMLPTAADVLERVRLAAGTRPESFRETTVQSAAGLTRRTVLVRSSEDYKEVSDEGPFHTEGGRDGGRSWRQNRNGETILEAPDPGLVPPESTVELVQRIATPVDGFLVSSLDAHGYGTRRYVEAGTWHEVREDVVRASGTRVLRFDDFRTVDGYTLPFHTTSTDGHPENDRDERVTAFAVATVSPTEVAIPPSRRTFVEFPAGKHSVVLPVHEERGKFIVRVTIGNRGLDLVLDSGASTIVLEDGVAKSLGLAEYGTSSNGANAGRYRQTAATVPEMHVGDLTMRDVAIETVPSVGFIAGAGDYRAVGLLGFDFFEATSLAFDYAHGTVTANDPATFAPPAAAPGGFDLDIRVGGGTPLVSLDVDGAVGERFLIDTGGAGSLLLFDRFVRRNVATLVDEGGGPNRHIGLVGIGGAISVRPYQLKTVVFGAVRFTDFVAYAVDDSRAYDQDVDGAIGPDFLHVFDVTFDYEGGRAYFRFNDLGKAVETH